MNMNNDNLEESFDSRARKDGDGYENQRWHENALRQAQYDMTKDAIHSHAIIPLPNCFSRCLEIGPGPGTWTQVLEDACPDAHFTLVDISSDMLEQAKENLPKGNITLVHSSADEFESSDSYDFFFSSRAIEYVEDRRKVIQKIGGMMDTGAHGAIVTKMPHYQRAKLRGREIPELHQSQIAPAVLKRYLRDAGFEICWARPATVHIPLINSAFLNRILYHILKFIPINPITNFFLESYIIIFKKV